MAPRELKFSEIKPGTKYYKTSAMVIEKGLPRLLGKTSTICQRLVFQSSEEEKIQGVIYGSIEILQKTLKISLLFCYLENPYRLTLSAKTPIEEVQIDGLTMRSLKYNFTQLADLENITETDAKLGNLHICIV